MFLKNKILISTLVIISILIIAIILISKRNNNEKSLVKLNVSAFYENKKFTITNNDTIDIVHANISINEHYKIRNINLMKGEAYTIWQAEFLHHNGRHFPNNQKPIKFSIFCQLDSITQGFYNTEVK